ncbi:M20 metallopeptidase family protein [Tindallia californiensis]|uniref:Amidohydrolase n=1 Tax=Tindallia californiensis TaxID=159292 RepID=A0A1H3LRR4_9FIRM|nr:amidohydrolase [Tindallia californiensis]SDY66555.1 amidohydrolase [Tindallia californiensis]
MEKVELLEAVQKEEENIIRWRRHFHRYPEVGFEVENTANYIAEHLEEWGLEVAKNVGRTGVVGFLKGGEGKTIALRADMDALPITETKETDYQSENIGKMHACAHDGHMAILLGVAKVMAFHRKFLKGSIKFIFQPAEEGPSPGGAAPMIDESVLEGVDYIFGAHLHSLYPVGTAGINLTNMMASTDNFSIEMIGKGGHAGLPHESIDAIALVFRMYQEIQLMVSRNNDPLEPLVISVGTVNGGVATNVIADKAVLTGTVRTQSKNIREKIIQQLEDKANFISESEGGRCNVQIERGLPPLVNHESSSLMVKNAATKVLGKEKVFILEKPNMGAEDFAYYLEEVPGAFYWIGAGNKEKGMDYVMHHPQFDFDEKALINGTKIFIQTLMDVWN